MSRKRKLKWIFLVVVEILMIPLIILFMACFREHGDQRRSVSYTTAFSSSQLCSQIVKWVKNQIPVEDSSLKSKGNSPKALISK